MGADINLRDGEKRISLLRTITSLIESDDLVNDEEFLAETAVYLLEQGVGSKKEKDALLKLVLKALSDDSISEEKTALECYML